MGWLVGSWKLMKIKESFVMGGSRAIFWVDCLGIGGEESREVHISFVVKALP